MSYESDVIPSELAEHRLCLSVLTRFKKIVKIIPVESNVLLENGNDLRNDVTNVYYIGKITASNPNNINGMGHLFVFLRDYAGFLTNVYTFYSDIVAAIFDSITPATVLYYNQIHTTPVLLFTRIVVQEFQDFGFIGYIVYTE